MLHLEGPRLQAHSYYPVTVPYVLQSKLLKKGYIGGLYRWVLYGLVKGIIGCL